MHITVQKLMLIGLMVTCGSIRSAHVVKNIATAVQKDAKLLVKSTDKVTANRLAYAAAAIAAGVHIVGALDRAISQYPGRGNFATAKKLTLAIAVLAKAVSLAKRA